MSTCPVTFSSSQAFNAEREAKLAADQLGSLLFDTPEFQTYIRLSRAVNLDEAVKALRYQIREQQMVYAGPQAEQPSLEALYASLEAVPKMREFRQAERALRQLFMQVDDQISAAAQAPFAHYARSGCG